MQSSEFIFPFIDQRPPRDDKSYFSALQTRVAPNFKALSMSSFLLGLNIVIFILTRIIFKPSSYSRFLGWPSEMNNWLLEIQVVKTSKSHIYQAFTALFMHQNYLHLLGNTIFGLFIMYEMQHSFKWSIPMGIVAGFTANCFAILTLEGRLLGFSGVLTSYVGMLVLLLITHLSYFERRMQGSLCWIIVLIVFLSIAIIGTGTSVLVHLFGYVLGMILALGFYPKHPQSVITPGCEMVFKIFAVAVVVIIIALAVIL